MRPPLFAIPNEHGAWALWLGPFLAGWGVAWQSSWVLLWTFLGILFAFMARHPLMIAVRALSGRRKREDARPAFFWTSLYGLLALSCAAVLATQGFARLLLLALPAIPLLLWQIVLVTRKEERQMRIELVGTGVLALAAPAAHIAATGQWTRTALILWLLLWLYAAVSIVYVYVRLEQRRLKEVPEIPRRLAMGRAAMRAAAAALLLSAVAAITQLAPRYTPLPFVLLQLQVVSGIYRPAVGYRPQQLGYAQVAAMVVFIVLVVVVYRI